MDTKQDFTTLHGGVCSFIRTKSLIQDKSCVRWKHVFLCLWHILISTGHMWDWNMNTTGSQFSSLVLLQLEYVPRQLGFGSFLFTHFSGISISFPNQNLRGWNSRKEGEPWQFEISTSNEEAKGRMNAVCYNPCLPKTHKSSRIQAVTCSA